MRSELLELTGGRGPDKCIDAVGMGATHGSTPIHAYDKAKQAARLESDRPHALRQAIMSCRNGEIDPTRIITHRLPLKRAPRGYDIFKHKKDNWPC